MTVKECSVCPPWVRRCAHFDEKVLWLGSEALVSPAIREMHSTTVLDTTLVVAGPASLIACPKCSVYHPTLDTEWSAQFTAEEYSEANAEFDRLEAQFLGRADA